MQKLRDTLPRTSRPEGPRPRPGPRPRRRVAAGTAVLLALLGPALSGSPAHAAAALSGSPAHAAAARAATARAATAGAATSSDRLLSGETLPTGQSVAPGQDTLAMQGNGNLVLLAPGHTPIWSSHTSGNQGAQLVMQPNGNLAVVAPGGQTLWSAGTAGHSGAMLVLQPSGNAVIQAPPSSAPTASSAPASSAPASSAPASSTPASSAPLWSTDTFRQAYADIQLAAHGWSQGQARQFSCLDNIWRHESK